MKKPIYLFLSLLLFATSPAHAQNLWQETTRTNLYDREFNFGGAQYTIGYQYKIERVRSVTVNLDNTLFGRAQRIGNVDATAHIRSAWAQGYTGQGVTIGVLDAFINPQYYLGIRLNNLNSNETQNLTTTTRFSVTHNATGNEIYSYQNERSTNLRPTQNDRNFSAAMTHGEVAAAIAGGKYRDRDGTLLMGIAKDANMVGLEYTSPWGRVFSARKLDFINASISATLPITGMAAAYRTMDNSGTYGHDELPVYISSAGNNHGVSASYSAIASGTRHVVDYNNAEMALSNQQFDGRPLSDYLLVAGGVVKTGTNTYAVAGNMPGEVTELQNRWLVAPYLVRTDAGYLAGTSFAAPYVAGVAAIVNSKFPTLAPADVANLLLNTTRDLGATGTDAVYGRGMVDLHNALSPQ